MNTEIEKQIDEIVEHTLKTNSIPGVTLAIVEDKHITFARAYGVRSLETQEPLRVDSLFHLASVTKVFVATTLLQLAERGQLELDAPIVRYLPYFQLNDPRTDRITIRQMMMHTSGMPDTDDYAWENPEYDDGALERYVRSVSDLSLLDEPGAKYFYSNIAFEVLGDVIAKVSGMTFEAYVAENILSPLRMDKSTLLVRETDPELLATPHTRYHTDIPIVSAVFPYNRAHAPSSTLYSNVLDMSRFAIACLNRGELDGTRILKKETIDAAWTPAAVKNGEYWPHIGLTWNIGTRLGQRIVGHGGEDVGFSSMLHVAPDGGLALVYLVNLDMNLFDEAGDAIWDLMLSETGR